MDISHYFATVWADVADIVVVMAHGGFDPFLKWKAFEDVGRCLVDVILVGITANCVVGRVSGCNIEDGYWSSTFIASSKPFCASLEVEICILEVAE